MVFQPGVSGNPEGRRKGSRNRRTQQIVDLIQGRGDKDPLDALSEIITTNKDPNIVATASNILAPYLHSKRSAAPTPRYVETPIEVPTFNTVQEAEAYLASLPVLLGKGEIDSQTALELSTLIKNWLSAIYERQEYDLKLSAAGGVGDTVIKIEGGLPALPGTNVTMPTLNGHHGNDLLQPPEPPTLRPNEDGEYQPPTNSVAGPDGDASRSTTSTAGPEPEPT